MRGYIIRLLTRAALSALDLVELYDACASVRGERPIARRTLEHDLGIGLSTAAASARQSPMSEARLSVYIPVMRCLSWAHRQAWRESPHLVRLHKLAVARGLLFVPFRYRGRRPKLVAKFRSFGDLQAALNKIADTTELVRSPSCEALRRELALHLDFVRGCTKNYARQLLKRDREQDRHRPDSLDRRSAAWLLESEQEFYKRVRRAITNLLPTKTGGQRKHGRQRLSGAERLLIFLCMPLVESDDYHALFRGWRQNRLKERRTEEAKRKMRAAAERRYGKPAEHPKDKHGRDHLAVK